MQNISKYIQIFLTDSRKELEKMNQILLQLEKDPQNTELINALFRTAHSLKGMAATMGYQRLTELCHALEEPLSKAREEKLELTNEMINLFFEGADLISGLVEEEVNESPSQLEYKSFITRLKGAAEFKLTPSSKERITFSYKPPQSISVDTHILDDFINIVGEMILRRNRLIQLNRPLFSYEIEEEMETLDNLIRELYSQVLKIRMLPVSTITDLLHRIVRDLAQNQGKEITFTIEGDKEINLDRTILEELMDPLIHLIRNAVDHGIEPPAIRKEKGKGRGKVSLKFAKERDMVRVEVKDDGEGIDVGKVKEQALKNNIIEKEKLDSIDNEDILTILCTPGFSTSKQLTEVSGRGVGLDVVKEKVEKLGGSIQMRSEYGAGTVFILKIPVSTHIIYALLIKLNSQTFAIPITKVLTTTKIPIKDTQKAFIFRDEQIRLVRLKDLLGIKDHSKEKEETKQFPVVIAEIGGKKRGLIVDELLRIDQVFVKPLGKPLDKIEGFYGVTILGDGRMVLVLELERLR